MSETEKSGAPAAHPEQPSRRHRSKQERRQIVEETLKPGASVAVIARRHGVNANQVFAGGNCIGKGVLEESLRRTRN